MSRKFPTVKERKRAYSAVFNSDDGQRVLAELADLAGFDKSGFHPDPIVMARGCGKREVVQEIFRILELGEDRVYQLDNATVLPHRLQRETA